MQKGYVGSNNTNKLSPQEQNFVASMEFDCSNNTNKLSPQEPFSTILFYLFVQIIQINLVLKNYLHYCLQAQTVQIIQINLVLKNLLAIL